MTHDISGHCDVSYQVKGSFIRKTKRNCVSPLFDSSLSQTYGVRSSTLQHLITVGYETKKEKSTLITKCTATDYLKTFSNIWKKPSLCLITKSVLQLEESTQNSASFSRKSVEEVLEQLKSEYKLEETDIDATSSSGEEKSPRKVRISFNSILNDPKTRFA
ncbi:uncharacterized protein LOC129221060 [Uloborus diversus]|uniref:uncharacterized protein LOC129221060 n=1 Tax=Uloborus diversus TaxID=327109 RepID=UPI002409D86E|nr:uncharacterized protein LOC129221060 [Uloborus diversus]